MNMGDIAWFVFSFGGGFLTGLFGALFIISDRDGGSE